MEEFTLIHPRGWEDYELLDSGGYEKLERFGSYILSRPEPQACWNKSLTEAEWEHQVHAKFIRATDKERNSEKGRWVCPCCVGDGCVVAFMALSPLR